LPKRCSVACDVPYKHTYEKHVRFTLYAVCGPAVGEQAYQPASYQGRMLLWQK